MDVLFENICRVKGLGMKLEFIQGKPKTIEGLNKNFFVIQRPPGASIHHDNYEWKRGIAKGNFLVRPLIGTWVDNVLFAWVIKGRFGGETRAFPDQFYFPGQVGLNGNHGPRRVIDEDVLKECFEAEHVMEVFNRISQWVKGGHDVVAD